MPRTPTGDAEVDAHVERLADADHLTTDGHLEVYEDVHRGLRDALTALDTRPGPRLSTRTQELNRTWQESHAAVSTRSWSAASWRARASTPAS